jgi:hypothetical protein
MRVSEALQVYPFKKNDLYGMMANGQLAFKKHGKLTLLSTQGPRGLEALATPEDIATG